MNRHLLVVGAAALALAACQKQTAATPPSDTAASSSATDAASAAAAGAAAQPGATAPAASAAPAAADFVAMAAASDMYEIQAAKIAEKRSKNADIKAFAKMMVRDHTKSTALIKKAVTDSGKPITPPADLPADKKALIVALNGASAADFDKTYVDQQVMAHKDALALMTSYSMSGDTPQLKDAAGMIVPKVQMHLDKINSIQMALSK
jgi:putative membrane protein